MPSSNIKRAINKEDADKILGYYQLAANHGLKVEWFTGGVVQGLDPVEAANAACDEWDV